MDYTIAITLQLIDNFTRQITQSTSAVQDLSNQVKQTKKLFDELKESVKSVVSVAEKLEDISIKSLQFGAPAVAFTKSIVDSFKELEQAKAEMEVAFMTSTGIPKGLEEINRQVEELGTVLPGSATDFYKVATKLKALGMTADEIAAGGLKAASYAWVLFKNEVNPEQAAEYMLQFANAFKIPAKELTPFLDQLQRLKFAAGITLTEISYTTKYIAADMQALGIQGQQAFKFMSAWIGSLGQVGLKGESAGTAISNILRSIPQLQEKLKKLPVKLNIDVSSFFDKDGKFQLEQFLITISKQIREIKDPLKRAEIVRQLFDVEGARAFLPLLTASKEEALQYLEAVKDKMTLEEYQALKKQIEEGGYTGFEAMAKKMEEQANLQARINRIMQTLANSIESLQGTFTQLLATLGEQLAPTLKSLADIINNTIGNIINWVNQHKTLSSIIVHTVAGVAGLTVALATLSLVVASLIKIFGLALAPVLWLARVLRPKAFTLAIWKNIVALIVWARTGQASTGWLKTLDFLLLKTKLRMLSAISVIKAKTVALLQWAMAMSKVAFAHILAGLRNMIMLFRALTIPLLTNPIFLVITAIGIAIWLLWRNWDKVVKLLVSSWNWLKQNWQRLAQFLMALNPFTGILVALNNLTQKIFGISLYDAGVKLVKTLWEGIKSFANKPVEEFRNIVQKIRNMLPFSPAKEGPLKDIHRIKLIETIAQSIKPQPLITAMRNTLSHISLQTLTPAKPAFVGTSHAVNINISFGDIKLTNAAPETAKAFASELEKQIREVLRKIDNERFRRAY